MRILFRFQCIESKFHHSKTKFLNYSSCEKPDVWIKKCKKFEAVCSQLFKIQSLESQTIQNLSQWQQGKVSFKGEVKFEIRTDKENLLKKVRMIKLAHFICTVVQSIFVCLAILACSCTLFSSNSPLRLELSDVGSPAFLAGFGIGIVINIHAEMVTALFSKTLREKRVCTSVNFQGFVNKYVIEKNQFIPDYEHLIDGKLHDIYMEWKKQAKAI